MRTKLRTQQVIIDMPKEGEDIWLHITLQSVDKDDDGTILNTSTRTEQIHKTVSESVTEIHTIFDPVLQKEVTISGAGVHMALADAILKWTAEQFGGVIEGLEVWVS